MFAALASSVAAAGATVYSIDAGHSAVGFKVRHMMVSVVSGRFARFSGEFSYDAKNIQAGKARATIDAASIDTGVAHRDDHLRGPDFFDAEKFPTLEFSSTGVQVAKDGKAKLLGALTMHGISRPVALDLEMGGTVNVGGASHAGFVASGAVSRKDFGMTWNKALEAGGVAVGDEVRIVLEIEGVEKKPGAAKKK